MDYWTVKRSDVRSGDQVIVWQTLDAQGRRGIVALGEVVGDSVLNDDADNPDWIDDEDAASRGGLRFWKALFAMRK